LKTLGLVVLAAVLFFGGALVLSTAGLAIILLLGTSDLPQGAA
jgi:hypothetical protein